MRIQKKMRNFRQKCLNIPHFLCSFKNYSYLCSKILPYIYKFIILYGINQQTHITNRRGQCY